MLPEVATLRSFASGALAALDRLRDDLEEGRATPDDALDELRRVRDELTTHLDALAAVVATRSGRTASERTTMRQAMQARRRRTWEPTILGTADPSWTWYGVSAFGAGYREGRGAVLQTRSTSSSSSGGVTTGYSGGGSFSGSGSSSRF